MLISRVTLALALFFGGSVAKASLITSVTAPAPEQVLIAAPAETEVAQLSLAAPEAVNLTGVSTVPTALAVTTVATTPEPASFALLGTGLILMALLYGRARLRRWRLTAACERASRTEGASDRTHAVWRQSAGATA